MGQAASVIMEVHPPVCPREAGGAETGAEGGLLDYFRGGELFSPPDNPGEELGVTDLTVSD